MRKRFPADMKSKNIFSSFFIAFTSLCNKWCSFAFHFALIKIIFRSYSARLRFNFRHCCTVHIFNNGLYNKYAHAKFYPHLKLHLAIQLFIQSIYWFRTIFFTISCICIMYIQYILCINILLQFDILLSFLVVSYFTKCEYDKDFQHSVSLSTHTHINRLVFLHFRVC